MASWPIEIPAGCPFTLANIPFGIFSIKSQEENEKRVGTAIGSWVLDLAALERASCFDGVLTKTNSTPHPVFQADSLNVFASLPGSERSQTRQQLIDWLGNASSPLFANAALNHECFIPMSDVSMHVPFTIGDFADFMCADVHVANCSRLAGASTPPAHYAMPLGYNGRAASVNTDGVVKRPYGIIKNQQTSEFINQPSQRLDYEAELGVFIAEPLAAGKVLTADEAYNHVFGIVILNDWSARDIQFSEMTPLGPFNGKATSTSISPWVVTLDALEGARCGSNAADLTSGGSSGAAHLKHAVAASTWDIEIKVSVTRPSQGSSSPLLTTTSNLRDLRWSPSQMIAHLASSGAGLKTGDLIGTGTISSPGDSPEKRTLGCLFEITEAGKLAVGAGQDGRPLQWLEDGDEVVMTASAGQGAVSLGALYGRVAI